MARYDYRCATCGDVAEVTHPIGDDPVVGCGCGGRRVRLIGLPRVMPSATPTRGEGGRVWLSNYSERRLSKDMDAYKRARLHGDQPETLHGQAEREVRADTESAYLGRKVDDGIDLD